MSLNDSRILVTGGTGSIGREVVSQLLSGNYGRPSSVWIFSRDEQKQYEMQKVLSGSPVHYLIGDIRSAESVADAVESMDYVIHCAAMKHVPACENEPMQAVLTNILGTNNIIQAIRQHRIQVKSVVAISTDKCCLPSSVMGMTKGIMERTLIRANEGVETRFNCVRSGNVIGSQGSVVPLFKDQASKGQKITVTGEDMTRFFISKEQLAEILIRVLVNATFKGLVCVPKMKAIKISDLAELIVNETKAKPKSDIESIGYRPGERAHETIISVDEGNRMQKWGDNFMILPEISPHAQKRYTESLDGWEYNSKHWVLTRDEALGFLKDWKIL